jgi:hypothetical protein
VLLEYSAPGTNAPLIASHGVFLILVGMQMVVGRFFVELRNVPTFYGIANALF